MDWLVWAGFAALIALFLFIDLGVLNRRPHAITTREALGWTGMWVSVALTFSVFVYFAYQNQWFGLGLGQRTADGEAWHYPPMSGLTAATLFLTGYVVEYSLSLDNMFVIAMIMLHLRVPAQYQHRVLFWGIIGAVVMRGVMILTLTELLEYFRWLFVVFGLLLIFTAVKMLVVKGDQDINTESSLVIRAARRLYP
ncbi:MAG TPA: hypothetical protein VD963_05190, partial [Phycisphaerales bacterium]|nr:hypothetical protein [Phycisphaerales bacterium]